MLLAIDNLTEYLNKKYFKDKHIEEEVRIITKTLYDPLVEERGIQKGIEIGEKNILVQLLDNKLNGLPKEFKKKIENSDEKIINNIKLHLFDIESIEELGKLLE